VKGKKLKVTFKELKAAIGYEIRYSTKPSMAESRNKLTTKQDNRIKIYYQ